MHADWADDSNFLPHPAAPQLGPEDADRTATALNQEGGPGDWAAQHQHRCSGGLSPGRSTKLSPWLHLGAVAPNALDPAIIKPLVNLKSCCCNRRDMRRQSHRSGVEYSVAGLPPAHQRTLTNYQYLAGSVCAGRRCCNLAPRCHVPKARALLSGCMHLHCAPGAQA